MHSIVPVITRPIRQGKIVGLTCRIGRVITGTIECIRDFVVQNKSILFLGRPGVGKTTKLREITNQKVTA